MYVVRTPSLVTSIGSPFTSYTFAEPSGTQFTDLLVMAVSVDVTPPPTTMTPPDGTWTLVNNTSLTVDGQTVALFYRQPGASGGADGGANVGSGGTYTFVCSSSTERAGGAILIAIGGASQTAAVNNTGQTTHDASTSNPYTMTAPGANALANALILTIWCDDGGLAPGSPPTGDTAIGSAYGTATGQLGGVTASYHLQVASGASGTITSGSVAASSNGWVGYSLAISPSGSPTATIAWVSA
jgi:hypothetical protein